MKWVRDELDQNGWLTGIYLWEGREITGPAKNRSPPPEYTPKELFDAGMITFDEYRKRGSILGLKITELETKQGGGKLLYKP